MRNPMIVMPSNSDFGQASSSMASRSSNIPDARIKARRPGIDSGSISAIASVFTKCPIPVKAKTRANPNRPAHSTSPVQYQSYQIEHNQKACNDRELFQFPTQLVGCCWSLISYAAFTRESP
jgi:hypothetical protein